MKIFKNKFFIITLVAALLLSIVPTVLCAMGQGSYVRMALQTVARPFEWLGESGNYSTVYTLSKGTLHDIEAICR